MGFWKEDWDPHDSAGINIGYDIVDNHDGTYSFKKYGITGGSYYRYENKNADYKQELPHLFWKRRTGEVFYPINDGTGRYKKLINYTDLDTNTKGDYASDDQLNAYADAIMNEIKLNQMAEREEQQRTERAAAQASETSSIPILLSVQIPNNSTESSILQEEYAKRKAEADKLLQNMLVKDTFDTPEDSDTTYYNYGSNQIDLKYYLHNLGTNLQGYIKSKGWNQAQTDAFLKAYNNYKNGFTELLNDKSSRFSTDDAGYIIDNNGLLSGQNDRIYIDSEGNTYASLDDIQDKKLRKSAKLFSPNDEVADYFNTVGQAIVGAGKVKNAEGESTNFSLENNGFTNFWMSKVNPAGGQTNMNPFLALDPVNPEGKRERTNRTKYLINELTNYYNYINSKNFKFNNIAKNKEGYLKKIQEAIDNLNNGWDASDAASLQAIGIPQEWYNAFMSEEINPLESGEDIEESKRKRKSEAEDAYIKNLENSFNQYQLAYNISTYDINPILYTKDSRYNIDDAENYKERVVEALNYWGFACDLNTIRTSGDYIVSLIKNAMRDGKDYIIDGNNQQRKIRDILPVIMPMLEVIMLPGKNGAKYLDDPDDDGQFGAVLCFKDNKLYFDFIGRVKAGTAWDNLRRDFESKYYDNGEKPKYSFDKQGGVLKKLADGGTVDDEDEYVISAEELARLTGQSPEPAESESTESKSSGDYDLKGLLHRGYSVGEALEKAVYGERVDAAKAKGMSYRQYNDKQRKIFADPDIYNKENGEWKAEDITRLLAMGADITSLFLDPIDGFFVNTGSTIGNFAADWMDKSVTPTETWKNLGMNVGLDLLSIIPVLGDAAGTGGKLLKTAKMFAPKIMYTLSAWGILGTLKNGQNIMDSLGKLTSDEPMTVGDWQNVAQAISTIAGAGGFARAKRAKHSAKKDAKNNEAIGLGLKHKDTGEIQDFVFKGEKAKEIRKLVNEGNKDKLNEYLSNLEEFKDYEIHTSVGVPGLRMPIRRTTNEDGTKSWDIGLPVEARRSMDHFDVFDPVGIKGHYASRTALNTNRQRRAIEVDTEKLSTKADVDAAIERQVQSDTEALKQHSEALDEQAVKTKEKLEGKKDAEGTVLEEGLISKSEKTQASLNDLRERQTAARQRIQDAEAQGFHEDTRKIDGKQYSLDGTSGTDVQKRITALNSSIEGWLKHVKTLTERIKVLDSDITRLSNKPNRSNSESNQLQNALQKRLSLQNSLDKYERWIHDNKSKKEDLELWQKSYEQYQKDTKERDDLISQIVETNQSLSDYNKEIANARRFLDQLNGTGGQNRLNSTLKQDLIDKYSTQRAILTLPSGRLIDYTDNLLARANQFRKKGGVILKMQGGTSSHRNVRHNGDVQWLRDFIMSGLNPSTEAEQVFRGINEKNFEQFNNLQESYVRVFGNNPENPAPEVLLDYNDEARKHQELFRELAGALNNRFGAMGFTSLGTSGDNAASQYADGLAGTMTWLRHVGRGQADLDWILGSGLLNSNIGAKLDENGMVKFFDKRKKSTLAEQDTSQVTPQVTSETAPSIISSTESDNSPRLITEEDTARAGHANYPGDATESGSKPLLKDDLGDVIPKALNYLRYHILDRANAKRAEKAMAGEVPYYMNTKHDNVLVHGDLSSKMNAERVRARARSAADRALTSDGALQLAFKAQLYLAGEQAAKEWDLRDNATYRATQEADLAQRKENHGFDHTTAELNKLSAIKSRANKLAIQLAIDAQRALDRDNLLQEIIYEAKTKQAEKKAKQEYFDELDIKTAVKYHPNDYGADLTPEELALYNSVIITGSKKSEDLSKSELSLLLNAKSKVDMAVNTQFKQYKGIPDNPWSAAAKTQDNVGSSHTVQLSAIPMDKDGAKIRVEKIREKVKNADRLQKNIHKQQELLDKKLDRISKSMYGLPNAKHSK